MLGSTNSPSVAWAAVTVPERGALSVIRIEEGVDAEPDHGEVAEPGADVSEFASA